MGSGFSKMKKQARLLEQQMQQANEELKAIRAIGVSGAGRVKVTLTGEMEVVKVEIDPECIDKSDVEGLQDLIAQAFADAKKKVDEQNPNKGGSSFPFSF